MFILNFIPMTYFYTYSSKVFPRFISSSMLACQLQVRFFHYNHLMQCQIKSKYRGIWQQAKLTLDSDNMALVILRDQKPKSLPFHSVSRCEVLDGTLMLQSGERVYEMKGERVGRVVQVYKLWTFFRDYKEVPQQKMQKPKCIDYKQRAATKEQQLRSAQQNEQKQLIAANQAKANEEREEVEYEQYYKTADWRRDPEEGGLLFINDQKRSMQPKIFKFLISRFLSTGSFMGISFPVFAMKPESILETYCRCLSLAPRLLTGLKNPIERMKAFNAVILTCSLRFIDIDKAFNPAIGETFQTQIQGCQMTAQQVSHHPPITAFLLIGDGFEMYGSLEVQASLGLNAARGRFYGDIVVEYEDGGRLIGRLPCGVLYGYLFGKNYFNPDGACYAYDPVNQLISSYRVTHKDVLEGYIGKLNRKTWLQFSLLMRGPDNDTQRRRKYEDFQHIEEEHCQKIYTKMKSVWTKSIHYDDTLYIDFENGQFPAPKLTRKIPKNLLPSDSRHRRDMQLRREGKMDESQQQKERIEQEQRRNRKLREEHASKGK